MSIKIGNNNKISKSTVGHQYNGDGKEPNNKKTIWITIIITLLGGFLFTFPFWTSIAEWFEGLFK